MSKSKRLDKELLSKSIDEVLGMDDTDLVNNVVDILISSDIGQEHRATRPGVVRRIGMGWTFLNRLANVSELAKKITDWMFPVPKTPPSFYADIW